MLCVKCGNKLPGKPRYPVCDGGCTEFGKRRSARPDTATPRHKTKAELRKLVAQWGG